MKIRGIERGDKNLRHFTFDDEIYKPINGVYCYQVTYDKNKLEGEYAENETGYVPCNKVMPLGGKKPKPIPGVNKKNPETLGGEKKVESVNQKDIVYGPSNVNNTTPVVEKPKRGRPPKVKKVEGSTETIPVAVDGTSAYEYYVAEMKITDTQELQDSLNELGSQGWELCCYDVDRSLFSNVHITMIFKRKRG